MDQNELNEVGTLLHILESIATNHPNLQGIGRNCQRRLNEIEAECKEFEADEAKAIARRQAERDTRNYSQPRDGSEKVVTPADGPANSAVERKDGTVEKLSTDKRTAGEKLMDQPIEELPESDESDDDEAQMKIADRRV